MNNKPPIDPALLERIEKEIDAIYPYSHDFLKRDGYRTAATSYALKLDIAMKALENISALGYEYPVGSAIEIADRALKQLNNGE